MKAARTLLLRSSTLAAREPPRLLPVFAAVVASTSQRSHPVVPCTRAYFSLSQHLNDAHVNSVAAPEPVVKISQNKDLPAKETLLKIDYVLEHLAPRFMKGRLNTFFELIRDDVIFEDKLFNVSLNSSAALLSRIARIRLYYRWMSPFNKLERIGSCIYEGEDVIVLLWRLSSLKSSFIRYFPEFVTRKKSELDVKEGALDIHVNSKGEIYKIINRKITASDLEGAKVMAALKEEQSKEFTRDPLKRAEWDAAVQQHRL